MIDYVWYDGDIPRPPYPTVGARPVLSGLRATVAEEIAPVSYTHLTLPTIYSV